jgi:4-hydroxybenzoate polyprenyltransferase
MRPHQWYKNLVLFAGIVFAEKMVVPSLVAKSAAAFAIFCVLSGAGYIINDITDRNTDSIHPQKSKRPIASHNLSVFNAAVTGITLFFIGNITAFFLYYKFGICTVLYTVLTILYSVYLKRSVLLDVITVSGGFVIRAVAGAVVIDVYISPWLVLCAFMLALFLALCKRKQEHSQLYNPPVLDHLVSITATLVIMSYSLYTVLRANYSMMVTIPLVVYGLFRFLQVSYQTENTSARTHVMSNTSLMATFIIWVLLVVFLIYWW